MRCLWKDSPFFRENKIRGVKAQDFQDWSRVSGIIQAKGHLTQEGLDEILKIKAKMNKGRPLISS